MEQTILPLSFLSSKSTKMMQKMSDHFTRIVKTAKEACEDRKTKGGNINVPYGVLLVDFAQSFQIPTNPDQLGDMFSESPLTCGFFGITEECVNEQKCFRLREERSFSNVGVQLDLFYLTACILLTY